MTKMQRIICLFFMMVSISAHAEWKALSQGDYQSTYIETSYRKITDDTFGAFILTIKKNPVIVSILYNCNTRSVNWFEVTTYKRGADNSVSLDDSSVVNKTRQIPGRAISSMNPGLKDADVEFAQSILTIAPPVNEVCKR